MNPALALTLLQIGVSLLTLVGVAFAFGRIYERMSVFQQGQQEMKVAMFGVDGKEGVFLPRSEAKLLLETSMREREAQSKRVDEAVTRIAVLEGRGQLG